MPICVGNYIINTKKIDLFTKFWGCHNNMKSSKNVWMSERKTHALISDIALLFLHFLIKEEVIKVSLKKQSFLLYWNSIKIGLSPSKWFDFIYFIESPLKLMKNAFYFMLKALFAFEIFAFLSRLFGYVEKQLDNRSSLRPATLLKKKLWHRCFPVNFVKFPRTPFLQNISERLLLW